MMKAMKPWGPEQGLFTREAQVEGGTWQPLHTVEAVLLICLIFFECS